jgi:hypothetical protein
MTKCPYSQGVTNTNETNFNLTVVNLGLLVIFGVKREDSNPWFPQRQPLLIEEVGVLLSGHLKRFTGV